MHSLTPPHMNSDETMWLHPTGRQEKESSQGYLLSSTSSKCNLDDSSDFSTRIFIMISMYQGFIVHLGEQIVNVVFHVLIDMCALTQYTKHFCLTKEGKNVEGMLLLALKGGAIFKESHFYFVY